MNQRFFVFVAALTLTLLGTAPAANAAWQLESDDGSSSIKFGYLAKLRAESVDNPAVSGTQNNLFFRRLRLLAGGKLNDKWSFFFETDSPNLGKGADAAAKKPDFYIQDFVVTYKPNSDAFMLDFGMILQPVTYNSNQSAVTLLAPDYNPTSFVWNCCLDTNVGRDYGVRARGYVADDKLEYRVAVLSGARGADQTNSFRYFGRVMYNFFEPMKGLYYTGTTLGKKRLLSVGASYDTQEDYKTTSVDFFYDQPLSGNAITVQGSWSQVDGDVFLTALPKQTNTTLEAGFYLGQSKLMPFVQYGKQDFDNAGDVESTMFGVGYFFRGYNGNLKVSFGKRDPSGGSSTDTIWIQLQAFSF